MNDDGDNIDFGGSQASGKISLASSEKRQQAGEDNSGAQITVTGTTTKSVSITGALANEKIYLYLLR